MLEKRYDPKAVEDGLYEDWKELDLFRAGKDLSKPPFSLVIPPPNVTGKLHLGHAMDTALEDIVARYKRLCGYDVLWLPGVDHAGIATQAKVEEKLRKEGKTRYDLGREEFLRQSFLWKDEYAKTIHAQWAKLGLSIDYSRERFTLDEGLSKAVRKVFVDLYNEGLIYQGERIINWDPELRTALSNIEVVHQDDEGKFYYFRYAVEGEKEPLIVATTRPETMFGDAAVFVNPKDKRYRHLIGKKAINPANGEPLPIMADAYIDISFGTGAMKCTPAHDPNDYKLAKKYGLPFLICLDERARMTSLAGEYEGLDRYECREKLVTRIESEGHLERIERIVHSVGHSERSGAVVEPRLSKQWFVKMGPLAQKVLENQKSAGKTAFIPKRFEKVLIRWMSEVEDWCVSRQLWWGHRIPAYKNAKTGETVVSVEAPKDPDFTQDEDVLDTWFSSALWPFATMGWPEKTADFERYFPTDVLVTGYDIIFFWVARMSFQSLHFTGKAPFEKVLIHGLVRAEDGRKMSKSLGNGVDPMEVIDRHGADALRLFLSTSGAPGMDIRYSEEKVQASENYLNKIWNSARYVLLSLGEDYEPRDPDVKSLGPVDRAFLSRLSAAERKIAQKMDAYEFGQAASLLYDFVYDEFCSSYLELSKISLGQGQKGTKDVLYKGLKEILIMLHPFCPYMTERLYRELRGHLPSIMLERYPAPTKAHPYLKEERALSALERAIKDIRKFKSDASLAPNAPVKIALSPKAPFPGAEDYLKRFSFASEIRTAPAIEKPTFIYPHLVVQVTEEIDEAGLKERLLKERESLAFEVARSRKMLDNPSFRAKAPREKVQAEEEKLARNEGLLKSVLERLAKIA